MQEALLQIIDRMRGAWRFRWWSVLVAWVVCLIGWSLVVLTHDKYEATTRVYVDSQGALRPLLKGLTVDSNVGSDIALVRQAMLSRPQLERVAREAELDPSARTPERIEAVVKKLNANLIVTKDSQPGEADGVYKITYQFNDRAKALKVVQTLLNTFVEDTLGGKRTGQESAQKFLTAQIAEYEQRLSDAENRLAQFKKSNVGTMPDEKGDYFGRLQAEMTALADVRSQLSVAVARRDELNRQLSGEEPFIFGFDTDASRGGEGQAAGGGDVAARIKEFERRREELLLRFTEKHPEVQSVDKTLEELRARQAAELARLRTGQHPTGDLSSSAKTNPIFQNIQIEMKRSEVAIAELRQSLAQHEGQVASLRRLVDTVPETEAELSRLNRDYEVTKAQYKELLQRLETAKLSDQADRTGTIKFQVIDPPASPVSPVAPNKPLLAVVVLILGLGVAAGLGILLNELEPVFQNGKALAHATGAEVLGSVSRVWTADRTEERRRQRLRLAAAFGMLLVAFIGTLAFAEYGGAILRQIRG